MSAPTRQLRLRIEPASGSPVNDYRIREGCVEVRALDRRARPLPGPIGNWRPLDENDIRLHYALGTAVSKWLDARYGSEEFALDKAA